MSPVNGNGALGYTMGELTQRPGQVMDEIRKYQRPAYITRHGRFVATVTPLAPGQVESAVLAAMAREIGQEAERSFPAGGGRAVGYTMDDLTQRPGQVMDEIRKYQRPAYITRHGRFVATVTPLAPGQVESAVLAAMAREIGQRERR